MLACLLACLLTYLLTPWCRVLLEQLTGSQLVKKFPSFYGTRRFITAFTTARHLYLSWNRSIQFMSSHLTSWRFVLFFLIVVLQRILISSKLLCQKMHSLLKRKMLQLTLKLSLYMDPTFFGPFGTSSGSIRRNLAKVTVFVELLVKIHR
jgi:hypothetical protein